MRTDQIIVAVAAVVILGFLGVAAYDFFRAGYHMRPKMPPGSFSFSYRNGLRAILVDLPDLREERRYLGVPMKVPASYEQSWSVCTSATPEEKDQAQDLAPGSRLEAVCRIKVDEAEIVRGLIYTAPKA